MAIIEQSYNAQSEYDAYRQRMGYTEEKMKSIRYKMAVYDEFLKEYNYRKQHYGARDDYRKIAVSEKNRRAMIIESEIM